MPGVAGKYWEYFYTDGNQHYGNDKSHKAAWCSACFDTRMQSLARADQASQLTDPAAPLRPVGTLRRLGA